MASAALGMEAPPLAWVDGGPPILFCTGTRRPRVVISSAAVGLLVRDELAAALAHELAHLERRDPTLSWALMGARALMWFNPGVQVLVRAIARDAERIADERAGAACGDRLALASGLLTLYRATSGRGRGVGPGSRPLSAALSEPIARARATQLPLVPGSSLRGVLRDWIGGTEPEVARTLFGPETIRAGEIKHRYFPLSVKNLLLLGLGDDKRWT